MRIPETTIQEISDKINIVDVASEYTSLARKGDKFWGCCPFHNEKTPSFTVTEERNMFYCFGCGMGGSVFNFVMEIEHMNFVDSVVYLGQKAGVEVQLSNNKEDQHKKTLRESMNSLYERCCGSFSYLLTEVEGNKGYLNYLLDRGLEMETIKDFRLGYVPGGGGWLYNFLKKKSYSDDFLRSSGFFSKRNSRVSIFFDRIMFPVINHNGQVVAFSGRALSDNGPKYINSPETIIYHKGSILFGINLAIKKIRESKSFILCEGNIDVMALHQIGLKNAVAPLGTAFTEAQARLLKRYAEKGVILFDGDAAGIKATEKACGILEKVGIIPEVISLPEGMDPAEILKKSGPEALIKNCKYTINSFDYLLNRLIDQFGGESPESKESIAKGMLPYINSIISDVRKEACMQKLADELRVSVSSLLGEMNRGARTVVKRRTEEETLDFYSDKELYLMCALVVNSEHLPQVVPYVEEYGLESGYAFTLYKAISNSLNEGVNSVESILRRVDNSALKKLVFEKCSSSEFDDHPEKVINDSLLFLKKRTLGRRLKDLEQRIANAGVSGNIHEISILLKEKSDLDEKLGRIEDY